MCTKARSTSVIASTVFCRLSPMSCARRRGISSGSTTSTSTKYLGPNVYARTVSMHTISEWWFHAKYVSCVRNSGGALTPTIALMFSSAVSAQLYMMYMARKMAPRGSIQKNRRSPSMALINPTVFVATSFRWSCAYVCTAGDALLRQNRYSANFTTMTVTITPRTP